MRDPLEGLSDSGLIRTGADLTNVTDHFAVVHRAAADAVGERAPSASVYAYGSVVTGQARVGVSDVDLLTIGLAPSDAQQIGDELSAQFGDVCRGVEISGAEPSDFVGEDDEPYGNRVFLRHYCVLLAGTAEHEPDHDFPGDRRAARGFNGDIGRHAHRWRTAREVGEDPGRVAQRMARKSLLAVAGLVSVHDRTWTTDRRSSAHRWGEIAPGQRAGLDQLIAWTPTPPNASSDVVLVALEEIVAPIVTAFSETVGLWPEPAHRPGSASGQG